MPSVRLKPIKSRGFTLIELVVVITILGILAAFAIPRSAALQTEARMSKMQAALGSLKAAAALAHSIQIAQQKLPSSDVIMEGSTITMVNGYPSAALSAIGHAAGFNEFGGTPIQGYVTSSTGGVFKVTPDAEHVNCAVTYTQAASAGAAPIYNATAVDVTNCQ